jgi:4-amino-4-deoxy-L-arabinose transferase-like glycosyltransferase
MKKYLNLILLLFIVIGSFGIRFYSVAENPPALNWDEVSIGYNAYSILKTGKDEWNQPFPVHFKSYGEYKLPAQIYLSIPGIYFFGLNELGVRITPVIYGALTVLIMFFLGKELFEDRIAGLVSAFLLGISPWHIQLTRASFESSLATMFVVLGIWFLIKGFKKQRWFIYSMIPFALSVFTYNSARIFTPLFLLVVLLIYRRHLARYKKAVIISITLFAVLLIPLVPYLLSGERSARYKLVSITDDPGLIPRINENRGNSKLPFPLPRVIHNKITYISFYFAQNYLSHFTPQFLFISGAPHKQHHVQNMGELYFFQAPFLVIGLINLFRSKNKYKGLLFAWLLLAIVPVSVTNDSIPHALRTLIAAPFYQLISGLGFVAFLKWLSRKPKYLKISTNVVLTILIGVSLNWYIYNYYQIYPVAYSKDWQYGYKQVVDYIGKHEKEYDQIVFTRHFGEPHMFTLFFLNYDPAKYQNNSNLVRFETYDWVRVLKFDKFYFPDLGDEGTRFVDIVKQNPGKKILFIGRSQDFPKTRQRLLSVNFLNGERAFDIVEVK